MGPKDELVDGCLDPAVWYRSVASQLEAQHPKFSPIHRRPNHVATLSRTTVDNNPLAMMMRCSMRVGCTVLGTYDVSTRSVSQSCVFTLGEQAH